MDISNIDILPAWENIDARSLRGPVLILGAPDAGKSTLTRYLYMRLTQAGRKAAVLDGDPGQSKLGPPTTMTVALAKAGEPSYPPNGQHWQQFVGAVSPVGHMLPIIVGAGRLVQAAKQAGAEVILYDTTGLVDPGQGGLYLKLAKIDLLQPETVIVLHGNSELRPLLAALRRSKRCRLIELAPSDQAQQRGLTARQAHRSERFRNYFESAGTLVVPWRNFAVLPKVQFERDRIVALEDKNGFVLGLGLVEAFDREARTVTLRTPRGSLDDVDAIRIGDVGLDAETFRDRQMSKL